MEKQTRGVDFLKVVNGSIQSKTYSFGAATLVVVIVLIAFAIRPTVTKMIEINTQIQEKKTIITQLDNKLNSLASLTNEYATNESNIKDLPLIFPANGIYSLLMSNIDEICSNNGFDLQALNFQAAEGINKDVSILKPWSVGISVKGNKANIITLLQKIENMPMYPTIDSFSSSNAVDEAGLSTFTFELVVFQIDNSNFYN